MKYALSRWAVVHCLLPLYLFSDHDYRLFQACIPILRNKPWTIDYGPWTQNPIPKYRFLR